MALGAGALAAALLACAAVNAQEPPAGAPAVSVSAAAGPPDDTDPVDNERSLLQYLRDPSLQPIHTLLIDREMPLVGVRWGVELQFDVPLADAPDDAQPTLREAKIELYRAFGDRLFGKVTGNYNNAGQIEIGDSYFVWSGSRTWTTTLGIFKPAYSLEAVSKQRALTFMERALPVAALSERRSGGVSLFKRTDTSILNAGLFLFSPDEEGQSEKGQALVAHWVHAPLRDRRVLGRLVARETWLGASLSYRTNAEASDTRFRSKPEVGYTDAYFVDTGGIDEAERITRLGLEASKVAGAFSWQAELLVADVRRRALGDARFAGGYVLASWFLTGESRNYNSASGEFLEVSPNRPLGRHGWGAFELAARASTVNLSDGDIAGGRQHNLSFGLNWYLNRAFRAQLNLVKVLDVDRPGSEYDGEDPWMVGLRAQLYLH